MPSKRDGAAEAAFQCRVLPETTAVSPEQSDFKYLGLVVRRYPGYLKALGLATVEE